MEEKIDDMVCKGRYKDGKMEILEGDPEQCKKIFEKWLKGGK